MEFWSNSVRFSTFLYTEWEFLHAIFTTTRYLYHKNRITERAGVGGARFRDFGRITIQFEWFGCRISFRQDPSNLVFDFHLAMLTSVFLPFQC